MDIRYCTTMEMNLIAGSVTFKNLDGESCDAFNVGERWSVEIYGLPNSQVLAIGDGDGGVYPPPFRIQGKTDFKGFLKLEGVADAAFRGNRFYACYYMRFPNAIGGYDMIGYQDPNAPRGLRNVCIAIVAFMVQ